MYSLFTVIIIAMKSCSVCGKTANRANARSHSNVASVRRQHANLVIKTLAGVRTRMCTTCLRTGVKKAK